MPIDKSFLVSEIYRSGTNSHLLYVSSSVKNITIAFDNEADKNEWKTALTKCMEDRRQKIGFNYQSRGSMLLRQQQQGQRDDRKKSKDPVFTSYSHGSAAELKAKEKPEFYERMRKIELTRKYFEGLNRSTKSYLAEQQQLIKSSSTFAIKMKGNISGLTDAPWYRALDATSNMVAVHSHEMLRWKSVTELLIDSITWLLNGPVSDAEKKKYEYAKHCSELVKAKSNMDSITKKKSNQSDKLNAAANQLQQAVNEYEISEQNATKGFQEMEMAIAKGFVDKLKLFVQVQRDFHKDCYYDIRQCWEQLYRGGQDISSLYKTGEEDNKQIS
eukprot:CAMPEP_0197543458 /NCGR_PEP_ID=MMETSP1318-20131121/68253_1 /TAXON_ID=552666 /ORGANISM="Partenskyella glossopodia, Strain RCC365" /LENGTH=328 /DNA_ID=CAMNT_0043102799 /DNA_START=586 /DNA_END=1572 /DNA_ORIENTATION=+